MTGSPKELLNGNYVEAAGKNQAPADPDNNLSRGAPSDRKERIGQPKKDQQGRRADLRERKPEDLDREDAAIQREGIAGEKPGTRPQGDADFVREKG